MKVWKKFLGFPTNLKFSLIFYPFLLIHMMPIAWIKSIWEARILLKGSWSKYMGFHPLNAINSLFYRTQWINLKSFGRNGRSTLIGLGDFPLRKWFHLSYLGCFFYANAAPFITLFGSLIWALSHLVWMTHVNTFWSFFLSLCLLFSSTCYAMAFARQNYQILGWMFFPMGLFFLNLADLFGTTIVFILMTIGGGVTQIFFAAPIVVYFSYYHSEPLILATLLPAGILILSRLLPLFADKSIADSFNETAKLIGITSKKVRYNREMNKVSNYSIYFLILFSVGTFLLFNSTTVFPVLAIFGLIAFFINQRFVRVADEESMILLFLSLFAFHALQAENFFLALTSLWLVASPLPVFLSVQEPHLNCKLGKIIINPPFDHSRLEAHVKEFFSPVPKGESVYLAFSDPNNLYANIFDGYRHILEMPLYVASKNKFHLFPDWYSVSQTNYKGAPSCWGRSLEAVTENMTRWNAKFSVVYQKSGTELDHKWLRDYVLLSSFDWKDYVSYFRGFNLWSNEVNAPKWFLLKTSANPT